MINLSKTETVIAHLCSNAVKNKLHLETLTELLIDKNVFSREEFNKKFLKNFEEKYKKELAEILEIPEESLPNPE
mgnify:FL=1